MLLNSVLLILQETLEAALLISVLLAIAYRFDRAITWVGYGMLVGAAGALLYALNMGQVSEWFDYVGQEVVNALMQFLLLLLIVPYTLLLFIRRNRFRFRDLLYGVCVIGMVGAALTREGSEILLYLSGFVRPQRDFAAVVAGSAIGFGIGCSIGILLYYTLAQLPGRFAIPAAILLLALFAGNMGSQAVLQLTQADWIASGDAVWNTSAWLPENTITGQLMYALAGYEATPSGYQVLSYIGGFLLVLGAAYAGRRMADLADAALEARKTPPAQGP